jgi:hypothetical protein
MCHTSQECQEKLVWKGDDKDEYCECSINTGHCCALKNAGKRNLGYGPSLDAAIDTSIVESNVHFFFVLTISSFLHFFFFFHCFRFFDCVCLFCSCDHTHLGCCSYIPKPANTDNVAVPKELEKLADMIAINIHEVWSAGLIDKGWYVKSACIVHVGCTRCVTFSTANNMKIHVRITLTVECIRTCIFLF